MLQGVEEFQGEKECFESDPEFGWGDVVVHAVVGKWTGRLADWSFEHIIAQLKA